MLLNFILDVHDLLLSLSSRNDTKDLKNSNSNIREINTYTRFKNEHEKLKSTLRNEQHKTKARKLASIVTVNRNELKYADYLKLNNLWNSYMDSQFKNEKPNSEEIITKAFESHHPSYDQLSGTFSKSDFHGALVEVLRSKNPSLVQRKGIILKDTQNSFTILSEDNLSRTIPKRNSVFRFHWKNIHLDLLGNNLCLKSALRSTRKIKSISTLNL